MFGWQARAERDRAPSPHAERAEACEASLWTGILSGEAPSESRVEAVLDRRAALGGRPEDSRP
jgi:hypothetical protein